MVNIDGHEVSPGTAAAFFQMREAFGQRFPGCVLFVSDGLRTMQQQQALWDAYQNGTGNLAAYPNPYAPHIRGVALDLRDSWPSPGVASGGNERANWLRSNCGRWGFAASGYGFSRPEPWHYEYQGNPWVSLASLTVSPAIAPRGEETSMLLARREATNAAYAIYPTIGIKHVPSADEERLVKYLIPGDSDMFSPLNDRDLSMLLWATGFPELNGDVNNLPTNGAYYWAPAHN